MKAKKEKFQYACMNDEPLGKLANKLRVQLKNAANREELGSLENTIHDQGDLGKINAHERAVLTQLLGKKYRSFAGHDDPWHVNNQNVSKRLGR
jgi:hypothetical protein